ncbi:aminotransferase class I/II-fold pyridoxal phosphate-dependent enzyme [Nitrosopumilus sp. K4]|uniref:pyridoxal phosphate-dependent aminotransferase n=1 Tax=Nitrosopumilus sp. K4 TaxID=2795383 RepID=UPI001BA7C36C|nr:histidinol-phosphate transaminase [Nitrosopumilus sp. K4]QUC64444.1 aminotransferase class I/II-fold pyridoxal phosphate-dependent enzyme [Nitrosopumilus sp. K4]
MKLKAKSAIEAHDPVTHGGLYSKKITSLGVLDFSSNVTPAGMPIKVKKSIKKNLEKIENYPDIHSSQLLKSLQKFTNLSEDYLVVGNGAIEIIYNFCNAFLSKDTPVLIPIPIFSEYEATCKMNNCKITFFRTMDLQKNLESFISKIPKNGCVFICNPNNPTGKLLPKKNLIQIIDKAKKQNSIVFVDECFIELVPSSNESVISSVKKFDNVLVLRSFTKSFGLAGIRIGYAASSKYIISVLKKIKIPWSINYVAEQAAISATQNSSHLTKSKSIIKKEYDFLKNKIAKIDGFELVDSSTNFILIRTEYDSTKLQKKLLEKKILVRDCKTFRGLDNHFIRIAIKSHKDNLRLLKALERIK